MARGFDPFAALSGVVLDFGSHVALAGAEVTCRMDLNRAALRAVWQDPESDAFRDEDDLFRRFGDDVLVAWNLTYPDDSPVPANGDGMLSLPVPAAQAIVRAFNMTVNGLDGAFLRQPGSS